MYLEELALSRSRKTIQDYGNDLRRYGVWLATAGITKPGKLKWEQVDKYMKWCKSEGKQNSTVKRYFMAIKGFCTYLRRKGIVTVEIEDNIRTPQVVTKAPRIPGGMDIARMMKMPNLATEAGARDRAILELLYSSGLRAGELVELELRDWQGGQVFVHNGKGNKTRTVPVADGAKGWIDSYVREYRGHEPGYLFVTVTHKRRMDTKVLAQLVRRYGLEAGISGLTTHTLRHICATHLLSRGADIRMIQIVLGHSSILTTQRYTQYSSEQINTAFHEIVKKEVA